MHLFNCIKFTCNFLYSSWSQAGHKLVRGSKDHLYTICKRPASFWHSSLTQENCNHLKRVQKSALKVILYKIVISNRRMHKNSSNRHITWYKKRNLGRHEQRCFKDFFHMFSLKIDIHILNINILLKEQEISRKLIGLVCVYICV